MTVDSLDSLFSALQAVPLLPPERLEETARDLRSRFENPRLLVQELLRRDWLTPFQANRLLQGRANELVLSNYVLLDKLSEGGMGQVFKVRHAALERIQALKVIRPHLLASLSAVRRFQREAKAAAALQHANVVLVFDAGFDAPSKTHFLVMEFVDGIDLNRRVAGHGPLPAGLACEYIRQAALGLQHAHEKGLVHRDIKPGNLMLTHTGQVVKVSDFGLASAVGGDDGSALTHEGAIVGTPDYMAPEQALNAHAVDIRADIYSLGCSLYFLLAGKAPFAGGSTTQKLLWHQQAEAPRLEEQRPDLPAGLSGIIRRMMAKNAQDRPATPADVVAALTPFCVASNPSAPTVIEPGVAGPPQPTPATEAPMLALAETVTFEQPSSAASTRLAAPVATMPTRRLAGKQLARWILAGVSLVLVAVLFAWRPWEARDADDAAGKSGDENPKPAVSTTIDGFKGPAGDIVAVLGNQRLRHWDAIKALAISPDGRYLASAGKDRIVRLWDLSGDKPPADRMHTKHTNTIVALAFDRDGKMLVSGSSATGGLYAWDFVSGANVGTHKNVGDNGGLVVVHPNVPIGFSVDDKGQVRKWDLSDLVDRGGLEGFWGTVTLLAISGDGSELAIADKTGLVTTFPCTDGVPGQGRGMTGPQFPKFSLAYSADGSFLASGSADGMLRVWGLRNSRRGVEWKAHEGKITALAFAPDGKSLASGGEDGGVRLWAPSGEHKLLADWQQGNHIHSLVFHPNGKTLFAAGEIGIVHQLDASNLKELVPDAGHHGQAWTVAFSPDGSQLASAGVDGTIRIWDTKTWRETAVLREHQGSVSALAFTPDGKLLASGSWDATVVLWNCPCGEIPTVKKRIDEGKERVNCLVVTPDGKTLVIGREGTTAELWDLEQGKSSGALTKHLRSVVAAAAAPDGNLYWLATGDGDWETDGKVRLWRPLSTSKSLTGHKARVSGVLFTPDGATVVSVGNDMKVRFWDAEKAQPRAVGEGHEASILALAGTRDGKTIATADDDGRVILWDATGRKIRSDWKFPGAIRGLSFSPDGKELAAAANSGVIAILRVAFP